VRTFLSFQLVAVLAAALPAHADPVKSITLDDAVKLALAETPDAKAADEDVASADGALSQSRA